MPAGVGVYNSYTLAVADGASGVQGGVAQQGHASFAAAHQTVVNAASVWAHNHGLTVPAILLTAFPNNAFVEIAFYACPASPADATSVGSPSAAVEDDATITATTAASAAVEDATAITATTAASEAPASPEPATASPAPASAAAN